MYRQLDSIVFDNNDEIQQYLVHVFILQGKNIIPKVLETRVSK